MFQSFFFIVRYGKKIFITRARSPFWNQLSKADLKNNFPLPLLIKLVNKLKKNCRLYITGGEPSITEGVLELLEYLPTVIKDLDSVQLVLNSNFRVHSKRFINAIKPFGHAIMLASIDHIGKKAEYIRTGTKWNIVEKNLLFFRDNLPKWEYRLHPVNQILVTPTLNELNSWANKHDIELVLQCILTRPNYLKVSILDQKTKDETVSMLRSQKFKVEEWGDSSQLENLINFIQGEPPNKMLMEQCIKYLTKMDKRNRTDYKSLFPYIRL